MTRRYEGFRRPRVSRAIDRRFRECKEKIIVAGRAGAASVKRRGSLIRPNPSPFLLRDP